LSTGESLRLAHLFAPIQLGHYASIDAPETLLADRLSRFPEVRLIILFGSRARGDARFRADIDVAVECPEADSRRWFDIEAAAENTPTLLKIDLVRLDRAPADLATNILREGKILCERTERQPAA
jgi:predicted nucleotidyltransferase